MPRARPRCAGSPRTARARSIYASATAGLLGPRPGAIWFDSPAAENRPGRHGVWQRPVERRRVARAPLLLPMSEGGLAALHPMPRTPALVLPVPVEPSAPRSRRGSPARDVAALALRRRRREEGPRAHPRRLGARAPAGRDAARRRPAGAGGSATAPRGPACSRRTTTGRCCAARACSSPRRATRTSASPSSRRSPTAAGSSARPPPAPYPALALARALDPRLVSDDLAGAIRTALDAAPADYAERAAALLAPLPPRRVRRDRARARAARRSTAARGPAAERRAPAERAAPTLATPSRRRRVVIDRPPPASRA